MLKRDHAAELQQQIAALKREGAAAWVELQRLEGAGAERIARQYRALAQAHALVAELEGRLALARAADLITALHPRALIW